MKLIDLRGINLIYKNKNKAHKVLDGLCLELEEGEILGLVGESGCGKTSIGRIVVGLENGYSGEYYYDGILQKKISKSDLHNRQREIQMIFQDPYMSIDPMMKMYDIIEEPMKSLRKDWSKEKRKERIFELMKLVGLDESYLYKKSSSLSGGQLQRIGIARALACEPRILVCDEPVSALDVSVQAQILDRKSTRLNSSHANISYAVFCLKKKNSLPIAGMFSLPSMIHSYYQS